MYKILLCLRYLRTRYIALACIVSVTLGVATMIVVNSVMAGFSHEMRDRIHGILADIIVETNSLDGSADAERHLQIVRNVAGDHIDGMTATVEIYGMLSFQYAGQWITRPVTLIGTNPTEKATVSPLLDYLESYNELKEGNRILRGPLRSRDMPPSWELTEKAKEYRTRWVVRQRALYENGHDQGIENGGDNGNPFSNLPAPRKTADEKVVADSDVDPDDPANFGKQPAGQQPVAGNDAPNDVDVDDLFPNEALATSEEPNDPSEPLPGRLYIGAGLISFPYEDKETGEVRMMKMVTPGDDVKISTISSGRPPEPRHFNATVVDVFKSGMSEYDSNLVFCNLEYLQQMRGMIDPESGTRSITSIQIRLKDFNNAEEVVAKLKAAFPPGMYTVRTWEQKQGPLLAAVEIESAILNVLWPGSAFWRSST
jgi:lipoprotein-releasing system permease protein